MRATAMPNGGTIEIGVRPVTLRGEPAYDKLHGEFVALSASPIPAPALRRSHCPHLRAVLHHQGCRQGHGPRAQSGLWLRQAVGRHGDGVGAGSGVGTTVHTVPAAFARSAAAVGAGARRPMRRRRRRARFSWSRTIPEVADIATALAERTWLSRDAWSAVRRLRSICCAMASASIWSSPTSVMPGGMSGVELAHAIRKDYPDLPVVLTTGYFNALDKPLPRGLPVLAQALRHRRA